MLFFTKKQILGDNACPPGYFLVKDADGVCSCVGCPVGRGLSPVIGGCLRNIKNLPAGGKCPAGYVAVSGKCAAECPANTSVINNVMCGKHRITPACPCSDIFRGKCIL